MLKFLDMELAIDDECFQPNTVTKLFAQNIDPVGKTILDLGCGVGAVGIHFMKNGADGCIGLDIYDGHVKYAKNNCTSNDVKMQVLQSDIYSNLTDQKFDIIASDISGCAKEIADITTWFPKNVPTPENGWELTVAAIKDSKKYLNTGGEFYSAVLSFSDRDKIDEAFNETYGDDWEILFEKQIVFSKELYDNKEIACKYPVVEKRNRLFWTFYMYKGNA